jgi:hypothetical protein
MPASILPTLKYIDGTASTKSYAVFARRGGVVLALKPCGVMDGRYVGADGYAWLHAKLRSVLAGDLFAEEDAASKVSALPLKLGLAEAWPGIVFDRIDSKRASTVVGTFIRGSLASEPLALLERLEQGRFIEAMARFLANRVGHDHLVVPEKALAAWLEPQFASGLAMFKALALAQSEFTAQVKAHEETFSFQLASLQDMQRKYLAEAKKKFEAEHPQPDADCDD